MDDSAWGLGGCLALDRCLNGNWLHLVLYCPYAFAVASIGPLIGMLRYIWTLRKESKCLTKAQGDKHLLWLFILEIAVLGITIAMIGRDMGLSARVTHLP